MSVTIWALNELFTVRIYKRIAGRPDLLWANSYELSANTAQPSGAAAAQGVMLRLAQWESQFHLTDVVFDRAVFSSYVPDGEPYQPESFVVRGFTGLEGKRALGGSEPMPLHLTLLVRRDVAFGRVGRLLYRRVLVEGDVTSPSGSPSLVPAAQTSLQGLIDADLGEPFADGILAELEGAGVTPVMAFDDGVGSGERRVIQSFSAVGVTVKKFNNAFYNRNTPPAPTP